MSIINYINDKRYSQILHWKKKKERESGEIKNQIHFFKLSISVCNRIKTKNKGKDVIIKGETTLDDIKHWSEKISLAPDFSCRVDLNITAWLKKSIRGAIFHTPCMGGWQRFMFSRDKVTTMHHVCYMYMCMCGKLTHTRIQCEQSIFTRPHIYISRLVATFLHFVSRQWRKTE